MKPKKIKPFKKLKSKYSYIAMLETASKGKIK